MRSIRSGRGLRGLALLCAALGAVYALAGAYAAGLLAAALAAGEVFFLVMHAVADGKALSARARLWADNPNMYAADGREKATLFDRFLPHPHLGHVNHDNPPAGRAPATGGVLRVNSEGFIGPEFPCERPGDEFVVMVSGGSVAERFAQNYHTPHGVVPPLLEDVLNEGYLPPPGMRRFTVLNGAVGGWKQPQQLAMLCHHAHLAHAFVTLEGYNETMAALLGVAGRGLRFEYPWINLLEVEASPARKLGLRVIRRVHRAMLADALLSRSMLAYGASEGVSLAVQAWVRRSEAAMRAMPTTFESLFARKGGAGADPLRWAAGRYASHLRSMAAVAQAHGTLLGVFIQPCAAIMKPLTPGEKARCVRSGFEPAYRVMEGAALAQDGLAGMRAASLLDIFSGVEQDVYLDDAHFNPSRLEQHGRGLGHELAARAMAARMAAWWGFSPRAGAEEGGHERA